MPFLPPNQQRQSTEGTTNLTLTKHKFKNCLYLCAYYCAQLLGCSGISWTLHKQPAPRSRQITTPAPHHDQMLFLTTNKQRQSIKGDSIVFNSKWTILIVFYTAGIFIIQLILQRSGKHSCVKKLHFRLVLQLLQMGQLALCSSTQ